jgi:hypothetical protein
MAPTFPFFQSVKDFFVDTVLDAVPHQFTKVFLQAMMSMGLIQSMRVIQYRVRARRSEKKLGKIISKNFNHF